MFLLIRNREIAYVKLIEKTFFGFIFFTFLIFLVSCFLIGIDFRCSCSFLFRLGFAVVLFFDLILYNVIETYCAYD